MTTINNMVAEATAQRDRIFAAAAIMTVNQTYMAAVADEGLTPSSEAIGEAVAKLNELTMRNPFACTHCGDDESGLVKDKTWGWVCDSCREHLDKIDRETDWDSWDEERRRKLAEANEY